MRVATVRYHSEAGTWWAESPEAPGFTAVADTLSEFRELSRTGLAFYFETDDLDLREAMASGAPVGA